MKAKNRFWRILLMVGLRQFSRAHDGGEIALKSVTPALSIATSVPVPMAMPTSRRPMPRVVDPVAGHRDDAACIPQFCDDGALLIRQHICFDVGDAELACYGARGRAVVARQHDHPDALGLQRPQRLRRR